MNRIFRISSLVRTLSILLGLSVLTYSNLATAGNLKLDASHSNIIFMVVYEGTDQVYGRFNNFDVDMNFEAGGKNNSVSATIDVNSIDTQNSQRDGHLKSGDFFNAAKYSKITFQSTEFVQQKGNIYKITGDFTMKGVTKTITILAKMTEKSGGYNFAASLDLKRSEFGIDFLTEKVSEKVTVKLNMSFKK